MARWGFDQFDAMRVAGGGGGDFMGLGWQGLWFDSQSGGWGFDLSRVPNWGMDGAQEGRGRKHRSAQEAIQEAIHKARWLLSDTKCADFLKKLMANLGVPDTYTLDDFLKGFDRLKIVPTPRSEGSSSDYTAHVDQIGQSSDVHVDSPFSADLPQTLLHENFHTINRPYNDRELALAATGIAVSPGLGISVELARLMNSRAVTQAFDTNCIPK